MKKITLLIALAIFSFCWQGNAQVCTGFSSTTTDTTTLINDVSTTGGVTNISNLGTGLSAGRYIDYFATNAVSSYVGGSFDFNVAIQGGTVGCAIWVDWNGDSTFDVATEKVFNTTAYGNGPFTGTITVPGGTANGDYYMRIMIDWNDPNPDDNPCSYEFATGRGEVEDYKVTVGDAPTDTLDYYNLQWPSTGSINAGDAFDVYAQAYEAGLTDVTAGQAPGITCWIGYSLTDTDPSGVDFTWVPANFGSEAGNNDEYTLDLGAAVPTSGTYYYASRWSLNGGPFTYGGIQADGSYGGVWGDDNNISGVLTVSGPANDECSSAVALTVNADLNCGVVTSGTTFGASASAEDATGVSGTPNTDVWYSFVATTPYHQVSLSNVTNLGGGTSTSTDMGMAVYDATGGCGALTFFATSDPNTLNLTGLTVSNTYYVRVYGWQTGIQNNSFDICVGTLPPPPANDDCGGALPITESTDLSCDNTVSGTTVGAYASSEDDCSTTNADVWYVMTAAQTNTYKFKVTETQDYGFSSTYVSVFEGSCGALTQVGTACFSSNTNLDLVSGTTYYINVRSTSTTAGVDFDLCVAPYPPAPVNDDCAGALTLNESPDSDCANALSGTTVSATASTETDCSTTNKDVWYTFVPTLTNDYVIKVTETQDYGTSSTYVSIFEGGCGSLTQVGSACTSTSITVSLTASTTYYVSVRSTSTTEGVDFDLCAFPLPAPPSNDECDNAIALTVNPDYNCGVVTAGTTVSATASAQADDVVGTPNNDVWFSFQATATSHLVTLQNVVAVIGTSTDMGMGVYDGTGGCNALAFVDDSDPNSLVVTGLTVGVVYYVRVYGYSSSPTSTAQTNFDICVGTEPAAPANDDCSGAIALTPGAIFSDNPVDGTVGGATADAEDVDVCGQPGPGVWYSVVVPGDGNITIETGPDSGTGNTAFDSVIEAFTGSCGALTSIECDDDDADTFNFSLLNLTGLAPGSTIYIRVWEYDGNEFEPFAISAYNATLSVETSEFEGFKYFPNPVNDKLSLRAQSAIQSVAVYNMLGQQVLLTKPNTDNSDIEMSNLQSGAYFVRVTINDRTETIRVIKN